ncbi:hypothetical protein AtNW77_Chr2g0237271 [Arabidopsis thaliana]
MIEEYLLTAIMYFTVWNTGMTKKSRGKKRIRINVYRPKIAPAKNKKP